MTGRSGSDDFGKDPVLLRLGREELVVSLKLEERAMARLTARLIARVSFEVDITCAAVPYAI